MDEPRSSSSSVPTEGETTNRWVRGIIESEGAWDVPGVAVPSLGVQVRADDVELAAQMTDTECALACCLVAVGGRCMQEAHLREKRAVGGVGREDLVERFAVDGADVGPQRLQMGRFHHDGERCRAPHGLRQPQKGLRAVHTGTQTRRRSHQCVCQAKRTSCREKKKRAWVPAGALTHGEVLSTPMRPCTTGLPFSNRSAKIAGQGNARKPCMCEGGGSTHLRGPRK